jgi:CRP-like cAMP-binding protein
MPEIHPYLTLKDLLGHPEFIENKNWWRKKFDTNQTVIVEGDALQLIYVILTGTLMVCTDIEITGGSRISPGLCELSEGEEFGHFCFFDDQPQCATVKATSACELAIVDADKLKIFFNDHPEIGYSVIQHWMKMLLPRLRQGNKRIASLFSWGLKAHHIDKELA